MQRSHTLIIGGAITLAIQLSDRIQRVKPSQTLAISALSQRLKAEGKDIIGLGVGEPDFDTPDFIGEAGIQAIRDGKTRYTPVDGIPELKQAIVDKFKRDNGLNFELDQVLASTGGKQCLYNLCQALLNDGDEVIVPAPYWVSYPDMATLAGGVPVYVEAGIDENFKLTAEKLEAAITPKTRLFFINSPSNPTGVAYSKEELAALGEVLLKHPNIVVATDDMYEHILFGGNKFVNILNATPELADRCVVFNGVSKAYAMTGWRIGFAGGPKTLIQAMKKVQGQSTSNPCSIAQVAAAAGLNGDQGFIQTMLTAFEERHNYVVERANNIAGMRCIPSDGTFYSFPNVEEMIARMDGVENDTELATKLLEAGVALVPGAAFGMPGYIRISYATSMENLQKAMDRIESLV